MDIRTMPNKQNIAPTSNSPSSSTRCNGYDSNALPHALKPAAALFAASMCFSYALQKILLSVAPKHWQLDLKHDFLANLASLSNHKVVRARLATSLPIGLALLVLTQPRNDDGAQIIPNIVALLIYFGHLSLRELFIFRDKNWVTRLTSPITKRIEKHVDLESLKIPLQPILLWGAYLTPPLALLMLLTHNFRQLLIHPNRIAPPSDTTDKLQVRQCISSEQLSRQNTFFLSPAFTWTTLVIFVSGIPAMAVFAAYNLLNVDKILGYPSRDPDFFKSAILVGLYFSSIGCCVSSLFLRCYFTFPLNFASTEYDIILDSDGIKKTMFKGWFATIMFWFVPGMDPFERRVRWPQVVSVRCPSRRFRPLPATIFHQESLFYKVLDKIAELMDVIGEKLGEKDELFFEGEKSSLARVDRIASIDENATKISSPRSSKELNINAAVSKINISIRLWELSKEEKASLYFTLRKWAPQIYLSPDVQQKLIGSTVTGDPRFTEIWFNLLTANSKRLKNTCLSPGDQLREGEFSIVRKIDQGGQAAVYLASCPAGVSYVIKEFVLPVNEGLDAVIESARDFENESTILSKLAHPKIVKLHCMFVEDNRLYLVLEKIDGSSLRNLVREKGRLTEPQTITLAMQMCEILMFLHEWEPPLIHRDFTPDNLILTPGGELKLIDFSLAQRLETNNKSECVGKISYTPPEQFRGEACPQSDIYAMGSTLHFLLTGSDPTPFSESHPIQKVPSVSYALDFLVSKATSLELMTRYESVKWLKLELQTLAKNNASA